MAILASSYEAKNNFPQISAWCSYFNTDESHQVNEVRLDVNRLVLYAEKPFREGSLLFVRARSFPHQTLNQSEPAALRSTSIMEVKWCRETEEETCKHAYAMGVAYLQPYA